MTRAEELLEMINEVGFVPSTKSPFKGQYRYNPGQKIPVHLQMRKQRQRQQTTQTAASYQKPWQGQHDDPKDKSANPLDKKYKPISVKRTG